MVNICNPAFAALYTAPPPHTVNARGRRDVDDRPSALVNHVRCYRLRQDVGGSEIEAHVVVKTVHRRLQERKHVASTGIIDENVNAPKGVDGPLHDRFVRRLIPHVGLDRKYGSSCFGPKLLRHPLKILNLPAGNHDIGTVGREKSGCRGADAGSTSRDDRHLALESERELRRVQVTPLWSRCEIVRGYSTAAPLISTLAPSVPLFAPGFPRLAIMRGDG